MSRGRSHRNHWTWWAESKPNQNPEIFPAARVGPPSVPKLYEHSYLLLSSIPFAEWVNLIYLPHPCFTTVLCMCVCRCVLKWQGVVAVTEESKSRL